VSDDGKTKIKKISPYPFEGSLVGNGRTVVIRVLKLTPLGFYADVAPGFVKVGEEFQCTMQIPVHLDTIVTQVKVMKTSDTFKDTPAGRQIQRLSELRFLSLGEGNLDAINRFISAIGQT